MMAKLTRLWVERSQREQRLLAVMFALLIPVILWFGIIAPVMAATEAARTRIDRATLEFGVVTAHAETLKMAARTAPPRLDMSLPIVVGAAGQAAGFTLGRLDAQGEDRVDIAIASAKTAALFGWLQMLSAKGIFAERIAVRPNSDATLGVDATLRVRRP